MHIRHSDTAEDERKETRSAFTEDLQRSLHQLGPESRLDIFRLNVEEGKPNGEEEEEVDAQHTIYPFRQ